MRNYLVISAAAGMMLIAGAAQAEMAACNNAELGLLPDCSSLTVCTQSFKDDASASGFMRLPGQCKIDQGGTVVIASVFGYTKGGETCADMFGYDSYCSKTAVTTSTSSGMRRSR